MLDIVRSKNLSRKLHRVVLLLNDCFGQESANIQVILKYLIAEVEFLSDYAILQCSNLHGQF